MNLKAVLDLPGQIATLVKRLPLGCSYTADDLIERHTLLPLYAAFLDDERIARIRSGMLGTRKQGIHLQLGMTSNRIRLSRYLLYCPMCVEEDRDQYGEVYWHRVWIVPGVIVCPTHSIWLEQSALHTSHLSAFHSAERTIHNFVPRPLNSRDPSHQDLVAIAKDVQWLLTNAVTSLDIKQRYLTVLAKHGFATYSGSVRTKLLLPTFRKRYSAKFLATLECELEGHHPRNWLARIVLCPESQHPLRHLLLIHFLGYTVEGFFAVQPRNAPFGNGPWPCLNKVCGCYKERVILNPQLGFSRKMNRRPLGTFSCPICGFTYSRTGPDTNQADEFRGKTLAYGPLWEERFRSLWSRKDITVAQKLSILGIGKEAFYHHVHRLGLSTSASGIRSKQLANEKLAEWRQDWLDAIERNPDAGTAELQKLHSELYGILDRLDFQWLAEHKPKPDKSHAHRTRNWRSIDVYLHPQVIASADRLRANGTQRPIRVTVNSITQELGMKQGWLQRNLPKLPRVAQVVKEVTETHQEFALRRIHWAEGKYHSECALPTRADFIKRSGLSRSIQTDVVMRALEQALQNLTDRPNFDVRFKLK